MAILVLLGAGASFGSEPNDGNRTPPLGDNLFEELCKLGGVASKVPDHIKSAFSEGFEIGMAAFNDELEEEVQSLHRELCSYLADFVPSGKSRYLELLDVFRGRDVIFSSLNYDMLLEESVVIRGGKISYDLVSHPNASRILKPHGSINVWPTNVPVGSMKGIKFKGGRSIIDGPVVVVGREDARLFCKEHDSISPAISMYAKGKKVRVCPRFVSEQQDMFARACKKASMILIIGVRVIPEDVHIWKPIRKSKAAITYFGSSNDESELKSWALAEKRRNVSFVNQYFDGAIAAIKAII